MKISVSIRCELFSLGFRPRILDTPCIFDFMLCLISGFRREVAENYFRLSCNAASCGFLKPDDGTDNLSRNFCKKLPLHAV